MTNQSKKAVQLEKLLTPLLQENQIEVVDVQYQKENGNQMLRIFIDTENGVSVDTCHTATAVIREAIDSLEDYDYDYLEVSSPGLDRILKKKEDFIRFTGQMIRIKTTEPYEFQKKFTGRLIQYTEDNIVIEVDQDVISIPNRIVLSVRLYPEI